MTEEMDSCEKILSARAYLYLLFHKLYGGEPTEELMEALGGSDTSEALCIYAQEDETIEKCQGFLERLCRELADDERRQRFLGLCGDGSDISRSGLLPSVQCSSCALSANAG